MLARIAAIGEPRAAAQPLSVFLFWARFRMPDDLVVRRDDHVMPAAKPTCASAQGNLHAKRTKACDVVCPKTATPQEITRGIHPSASDLSIVLWHQYAKSVVLWARCAPTEMSRQNGQSQWPNMHITWTGKHVQQNFVIEVNVQCKPLFRNVSLMGRRFTKCCGSTVPM